MYRLLPLRMEEVVHRPGLGPVSCCLERKGRYVILGPNGAGKSLFLRLAHGLLRPHSGRVVWGGREATQPVAAQAMVFQTPHLLGRSALGNVTWALRVRKTPADRIIPTARSALEAVGMLHLADRQATFLSGGERQRLAIARAMALQPEVIFFDEPTAHLDPASAALIEALVREIALTATVIVTTHNLGLAHRLADEVLFLWEGKLVERADGKDFFRAPRRQEAADFLASERAQVTPQAGSGDDGRGGGRR